MIGYITVNRSIFLGPGGCGKSYLANVFAMWCEKYLRQAGDNPDKPKVLIMAPTGIAAVQIGKVEKKIIILTLYAKPFEKAD